MIRNSVYYYYYYDYALYTDIVGGFVWVTLFQEQKFLLNGNIISYTMLIGKLST